MRKLQDNPNDSEAIKTLNNVQKEVKPVEQSSCDQCLMVNRWKGSVSRKKKWLKIFPLLIQMQNWALSKQEPGQFTGTTGVKVLSQEELSSGHQAWARKVGVPHCPVRPANIWVVKGLEVVLRSDALITKSFSKLSCFTSCLISVHEFLLWFMGTKNWPLKILKKLYLYLTVCVVLVPMKHLPNLPLWFLGSDFWVILVSTHFLVSVTVR